VVLFDTRRPLMFATGFHSLYRPTGRYRRLHHRELPQTSLEECGVGLGLVHHSRARRISCCVVIYAFMHCRPCKLVTITVSGYGRTRRSGLVVVRLARSYYAFLLSWPRCSHICASVTRQDNFVPVTKRCVCPAAGKVTVGLASRAVDSVARRPT